MQWNLGEHVLATPHHGEIRRLLPDADNYAIRADIADCFLAEHEAALIYKGARTIVTQRGKPLFYNITGDPGMATAGQGDVLAGICGGFIRPGGIPAGFRRSGRLPVWPSFRNGNLRRRSHPANIDGRGYAATSAFRHSFYRTPLLLK